MILNIIKSNPEEKRDVAYGGTTLKIAEMFSDTIQGEGINVGVPATFIRFQSCTLDCVWCDTESVWKHGNKYSAEEIIDMLDEKGVIARLKTGQHLILTGGSPLLQMEGIVSMVRLFQERFGFKPFIEVENECTIMPSEDIISVVDCWNNSPKLSNSGMRESVRYKPDVLAKMSSLENSWFKFVVASASDYLEIVDKFISTSVVRQDQIIIMPEGQTREEIRAHYDFAVEMATKNSIRFSDRLHVTIWDKKTGV